MTKMNTSTAEVLTHSEQIAAALRPIMETAAKEIEGEHPYPFAVACVLAAKEFLKASGMSTDKQVEAAQEIAEKVHTKGAAGVMWLGE